MKSILDKFDRFAQKYFGGHIHVAGVTIYGWNAMHCAINIYTKRWGYLCFHPTMYVFGRWWPWYAYVSRNATPSSASWGIGPGFRGYGS